MPNLFDLYESVSSFVVLEHFFNDGIQYVDLVKTRSGQQLAEPDGLRTVEVIKVFTEAHNEGVESVGILPVWINKHFKQVEEMIATELHALQSWAQNFWTMAQDLVKDCTACSVGVARILDIIDGFKKLIGEHFLWDNLIGEDTQCLFYKIHVVSSDQLWYVWDPKKLLNVIVSF